MKDNVSEEFKEKAKTFGNADSITIDYREQCKQLGADVIFAEDVDRKTVLDILESVHGENNG